MKNILFVINNDKFLHSHFTEHLNVAHANGYKVYVACNFKHYLNYYTSFGYSCHHIPFTRSKNILKQLKVIYLLFRLLLDIKPNVTKLLSLMPILYGGLLLRLLDFSGVIYYFTGLGYMFINNEKYNIYRFILNKVYSFSLNNHNATYIFENTDDRSLISDKFLKSTNGSNTFIIRGSGVDTNLYTPKSTIDKSLIVLFSGRLLYDKGIVEFYESAKILKKVFPDVIFQIAGDVDPGNPSCISNSLLNRLKKSESVQYHGFCNNMHLLVKNCAIYVLPSYREGLPKSITEAASCGKPIVTTDVPGCRDTVVNNISGFIVPRGDHISLANAIEKLLTNPQLISSMGSHSRHLATSIYSSKKIIPKNLIYYNKVYKENYASII